MTLFSSLVVQLLGSLIHVFQPWRILGRGPGAQAPSPYFRLKKKKKKKESQKEEKPAGQATKKPF